MIQKAQVKKSLMANECCSFIRLQRRLKGHQITNHVFINSQNLVLFTKKISLTRGVNLNIQKALEKQVNKLVKSKPNLYQKELIAANDIANNSRVLLGLTQKGIHKETYVNYAILNELQDYYYSRKTSNYFKPEPQLEYSIPLLSDFLTITSAPQDTDNFNITINDINAANKKFNRFKSKISNFYCLHATKHIA